MSKKESIKVLEECAELQLKKSNDYQNPNSNIVQADYYPRGVATILDTVYGKILRMYSVLEAMEHDKDYNPNFESLEDSAKDLINYSSFIVAYIRGKVEGQSNDRDFLNRKKPGASSNWKKAGVNMWDPQETEVSVSGVPYTVNKSDVSLQDPVWQYSDTQNAIRGNIKPDTEENRAALFNKLCTEPTYLGDNYWLRSDGSTFQNAHRPKPKDAK